MAKVAINALIEAIKDYIGEDTSDEAIKIIEDITDTISTDTETNWEEKYRQLDEEWRKKYIARFNDTRVDEKDDEEDEEIEEKDIKIKDLFKED